MNIAKTRAVIIGGALLLVVALGAFWLLPKNQVDETTPNDAGSALLNPSPETSETETPEVAVNPNEETNPDLVAGATDSGFITVHTVVPDETLMDIAAKYYGDPTWAGIIEDANKLANPNAIKSGDKLNIPVKPDTQKSDTQKTEQPKTNDTQKTDPTKSGTTQPNTQQNTTPTPAPGR